MPEDALAALRAGAAAASAKPSPLAPAGGGVVKRRASGGRGGGAAALLPREGSSFVPCPLCGTSVARALLDTHANECADSMTQRVVYAGEDERGPSRPASASPTRPPPPSALAALMGGGGVGKAATAKPPSPLPRVVPGIGGDSSGAAPSALAALMAAQRAAARVHTLYAEHRHRLPDGGATGPPDGASTTGQWFWHWAPDKKSVAALPQPAWSAESTLNLTVLAAPWDDEDGGGGHGASAAPPMAKIQLRLATNVMPGDGGGAGRVPYAPTPPPGIPTTTATPPTTVRASPSVLKSALQKNIRLGRGVAAVRLSLHLLRTDPGDLLRRLGVIMIEDCLLHPALPLCVWAMAAGAKGYHLPRPAVAAILRVVWQLAGAPVRDDPAAWSSAPRLSLDGLFAEAGDGEQGGAPAPPTLASQLPPEARLLVRCLAARAAYGGMACDVAMLRDAAGVWAARLAGAAGHPPALEGAPASALPPPPADPGAAWLSYIWRAAGAVPPPPPGLCDGPGIAAGRAPSTADVPLSAIDFHVSGVADDALLLPPVAAAAAAAAVRAGGEAEGVDGAERLRRAMWVFRSSINRRPRVVGLKPGAIARDKAERADLLPLWRVAAGAVEAWATDYIKGRFPPG